MMDKLRLLIKSAVSLSFDDSGKFRRSFSRWKGRKTQKTQSFAPHGTFGTPLVGNDQLALAKECLESNIVVLEGESVNRIKRNTVSGEYGIGNTLRKSYIYFKDSGDVEIQTGDTTVTLTSAGKISIVGTDDVELIDIIDQWMTAMINAKVITGIGLQPFDPVTITNMTVVQTDLQKLKV